MFFRKTGKTQFIAFFRCSWDWSRFKNLWKLQKWKWRWILLLKSRAVGFNLPVILLLFALYNANVPLPLSLSLSLSLFRILSHIYTHTHSLSLSLSLILVGSFSLHSLCLLVRMVDELPDCASGTAKQKTRKTHRQLAYFDFGRIETTPSCFAPKSFLRKMTNRSFDHVLLFFSFVRSCSSEATRRQRWKTFRSVCVWFFGLIYSSILLSR